jgi:hypothetical protein
MRWMDMRSQTELQQGEEEEEEFSFQGAISTAKQDPQTSRLRYLGCGV